MLKGFGVFQLQDGDEWDDPPAAHPTLGKEEGPEETPGAGGLHQRDIQPGLQGVPGAEGRSLRDRAAGQGGSGGRAGSAQLREAAGSAGSLQLPDSLRWNARRPLHLLGVPFSYLKEQVDEEV